MISNPTASHSTDCERRRRHRRASGPAIDAFGDLEHDLRFDLWREHRRRRERFGAPCGKAHRVVVHVRPDEGLEFQRAPERPCSQSRPSGRRFGGRPPAAG